MSSNIPFSIFRKDLKQYSLGDIKDEDSKTFVWHQFMLDVLLNIPRSPADNENVIEAARRVNEIDVDDLIELKPTDIDEFETNYASDQAINWYTRGSFLYRAFNKACRTLNTDAIIQFHSIVKDLNIQLKQLNIEQKENKKLKFPMTVYRGQATWSDGELEKLLASEGNLIAMNTFLSTTTDSKVACKYTAGADSDSSVIFQITINNDVDHGNRFQTFADISQYTYFKDEGEVLFGMSSVFRVISIEKDTCFWFVELELTDCKEDKDMQSLMSEVKTHLYQISGKRLPFIVFKQLFTTTSHGYFRSFSELMKFVFADLTQLFIINASKKQGRMKELIDTDDALRTLMTETSDSVIRSSETTICLLFDMLNRFLYFQEKNNQEQISFDMKDTTSLLCFGGLLLMTGECDKSIRYFEMLLKNDSIDDKLKLFIHTLLGASYVMTEEKELASKHFPVALQLFQSSIQTFVPSWFAAFIAHSHTTLYGPDQQANQTLNMLEPFINKKQVDDDVNEKLRLLLLGNICSDQQNFVDALNHWEDALEITSHVPSSVGKVFNAVIYLQMAAAYSRLNNISKAVNFMEKALKDMKSYYPLTHRMFAGFNLMYGYYLIQNERPSEGIQFLKEALANPYFSTDRDFLGTVYTVLVLGAIQSGDIDCAEEYCAKALEYQSPTNMSIMVPSILEILPQLKMCIDSLGKDYGRQFITTSLQWGQQMLSTMVPISTILPDITNDEICTYDKFIACADRYRHQKNYTNAEIYYNKALEKLTEMDANYMWDVYRKMLRMNKDGNNRYRDYFIEQYSKYDDNNPEHFQMISTLQIIMYKFSLADNELELAFDCLIYGTFMAMKSLYHQINIGSNYISDLFNSIFHHDSTAKAFSILTKSIEMYSSNWTMFLQDFLFTNFTSDDVYTNLAKIIHHPQIDATLDQMKSKYDDDQSSKSIFLCLDTLLQLFRQSIHSPEKSILSFSNQVLEFVRKYNDELSPIFYLMKTLESLLTDDIQSFSVNLHKLRVNTVTFERYKDLKEKISYIFEKLEETQLLIYLENIAKNL